MINPRFGKLRVAVATVLALIAGATVYFVVGGSQVTALSESFSEDFSSPTALQDRFVFHVGNACTDGSDVPTGEPPGLHAARRGVVR